MHLGFDVDTLLSRRYVTAPLAYSKCGPAGIRISMHFNIFQLSLFCNGKKSWPSSLQFTVYLISVSCSPTSTTAGILHDEIL